MIPEDAVDAWVASAAPDTIVGRLRDERKNMTNQVIPEAAVEAAAKALSSQDMRDFHWDSYVPDARAALEAAAPHMLADAWEQGMQAMYDTTSSEWPPIPEANPYRTTP